MNEDRRSHPHPGVRERHPASALLAMESLGLAVLAAAFLGAGVIAAAGLCVVLAAVAGGLAASIGEGLPRSGGAVFGFEGFTVAFAAGLWSVVAAVAVLGVTGAALGWAHRRRVSAPQIRRPVPCQ
jgi:hypothetical protein